MQIVRPDRVAIYTRWSTDDQSDGTTAQVQLEGCRHYLLSQGWTFRPDLVFTDDGYSGGDLNRPALGRLRAAIGQGEVDCVVLFKIDRLSRNVVDTVNLVLREWEGRAYVKSAREPIDTTTPAGKMFFYTLVSFAEWERAVIRERTMSGKLKRLQEGKNPGFRPPFGLATGETPGAIVPVESEAMTVRRIFARFLNGRTPAEIARELDGEGVRFRGGRPFTARQVTAILANPIYGGRLVYGRRMTNPRKSSGGARQVKNPAAPLAVVETSLPRLIGQADFEAARTLLAGRSERPGRSHASQHLLTGLLRCRCGAHRIGVETPSGRYYVCAGRRSRAETGTQRCDGAPVRQDELDRWVAARLLARVGPLVVGGPGLPPGGPRLPSATLPPATPAELWARLDRPVQKLLIQRFIRTLIVHRAPGASRVEIDLEWVGD